MANYKKKSARFDRKNERAQGARPNDRRASRSVLHASFLLKKWLNSFLFKIKRVIILLKALSTLRNIFSSRYSRSIFRIHFYNSFKI